MKVSEKYIEQIACSETIFDMAAVCYKILEEEISNPVLFISQYIDEGIEDSESLGCVKRNTNNILLRDFADKLSVLLEEYSQCDFLQRKQQILEWIREVKLEVFLADIENQLSVVFTLLSVIDSLVPHWDRRRMAGQSALNIGKSRESYLVYMAASENIHDEMMRKIGRERKSEGDFGETLNNLLFIKREVIPEKGKIPEVCMLSRTNRAAKYCVKVAVITGVTGKHFKFVRLTGSAKIVVYKDEVQKKVSRCLWNKMKTAIQQGAEFILFPEFCVSVEILTYIKEELAAWKKAHEVSDLVAVFLGTTWVNGNDNVIYILDAWGRQIGIHYKNTSFRKKNKKGKGYEISEGITNPGYRTTLLWVEGIGYVLPAVCRDVIDGEYTRNLVKKFKPAFLMVPAWSSSGSSFIQPLEAYAADYYTNSVLCNGCGALKGKADIVGGSAIPIKQGTVPRGHFKAIKKTARQKGDCTENCGDYCGYMLELDFSPGNVSPRKRIHRKKL